jgi:choline transport protein
MIAQLAAIYHHDYSPTSWQIYLIYIAVLVLCALVICLMPKQLPAVEKGLFFASITAIVVFFITVLATSKKSQTATTVFVDYKNQSGWPDGLSFLLSSGTAMYLFIGIDAVIHLTEVSISQPSSFTRETLLTLQRRSQTHPSTSHKF